MTERDASTLAGILGGRVWQPLPGLCYVLMQLADGSAVIFGDGAVRHYADLESIETGDPLNEIEFSDREAP